MNQKKSEKEALQVNYEYYYWTVKYKKSYLKLSYRKLAALSGLASGYISDLMNKRKLGKEATWKHLVQVLDDYGKERMV